MFPYLLMMDRLTEGCEIQGIFRDRLRVDGKLINCETGDRLVISKLLSKPIPRMKIGKYIARVFHPGQPEFQNRNYTHYSDKTCHKCLTLVQINLIFSDNVHILYIKL